MTSSRLMTELMREYDRERQAAARLRESRLEQVYAKAPRLREIDDELAGTGLALTKAILQRQSSAEVVQAQKDASARLLAERAQLLADNGFAPEFLTDVYKCAACGDTGFVDAARCKCLKQRLVGKYYALSNLGAALKAENFDTFDLSFYADAVDTQTGLSPRAQMKKILAASLQFVETFGETQANLLLHGATGLGKTFLCNCIAKEILERGHTVLYTTAAQLFQMAEKARFRRDDDESQEEYIEMVLDVDLLIIDDLGTEFSTSLTSAETFRFINTRLQNRKSTIISTNLAPADLEVQYSDRVISRLLGSYTMLRCVGEDIRLQKRFGG